MKTLLAALSTSALIALFAALGAGCAAEATDGAGETETASRADALTLTAPAPLTNRQILAANAGYAAVAARDLRALMGTKTAAADPELATVEALATALEDFSVAARPVIANPKADLEAALLSLRLKRLLQASAEKQAEKAADASAAAMAHRDRVREVILDLLRKLGEIKAAF